MSRPAFVRATLGGACLLLAATATTVAAHPAQPRGAATSGRSHGHRPAGFTSGRRLQLSVPGHVVVYNHAKARVRPTIHHIRARIVSRRFSTKSAGHVRAAHARKHRLLRLAPGHYTIAAHVQYRPVITHVVTKHRQVHVAGGRHRARCVVTSVNHDADTFTAQCTSHRYPGQSVTYHGKPADGRAKGDHVRETVRFHGYHRSRTYHLRERRFGAARRTTLRRHVKIRWGGYRRHTATRRGVATMHFNTSGPWTWEWVANCRDSFPYFGGVATSGNHVSSFNGHVEGGRNSGHIRVPWSGAVTLHIYDAGCTWSLTELSRHPFTLK